MGMILHMTARTIAQRHDFSGGLAVNRLLALASGLFQIADETVQELICTCLFRKHQTWCITPDVFTVSFVVSVYG